MSKSQIAPKGYRQSIPSLKFQKLAEVTCKMLTAPLYDFVFQ
jgi:fanconi anemia group I protein